MAEFKTEALLKMGFENQEAFDKEAKKVTVKGYRLSFEEKQALLFEIKMGFTKNNHEALEKSLLFERRLKAEFEQDMKDLKKMAKDAEDYAVKVVGWDRKDFKETYNMFEILKDDFETALSYYAAYGERAGGYYLRTYV